MIGPALARDDLTGVRLRLKLDHWFGELIPSDLLLEWVRTHGRRGVLIASGLLNAKAGLSSTARLLIKEAAKPQEVLGRLAAGIGTGVFTGSISNHMEGELSTLEKWAADEEPKIRDWARAALAHGRRSVERQKLLEQEEDI